MSDWTDIGSLDDIENEAGKRYDIGEHRIAVFRIGTDIYAIGDRCSHAEASLADGELFDGEVECPRHGSAFDLATGVPGALPATVPVPVYETKLENHRISIRVKDQT